MTQNPQNIHIPHADHQHSIQHGFYLCAVHTGPTMKTWYPSSIIFSPQQWTVVAGILPHHMEFSVLQKVRYLTELGRYIQIIDHDSTTEKMNRDEQFGISESWSKFMMPNMAISHEHHETGSIYCWVCLISTRQCASQERTNGCASLPA